jgi:hypothetical protein
MEVVLLSPVPLIMLIRVRAAEGDACGASKAPSLSKYKFFEVCLYM